MPAYLTPAEFAELSTMPASDIEQIEGVVPGWLGRQLASESAFIDSRLRKRYDAPFDLPAPISVQRWLAKIVTKSAYLKRGVDPTDAQFDEIKNDAIDAMKEIAEAANAVDGLFDLPLRTGASGIRAPSTYAYSEASPYAAFDAQRDYGRDEDLARRGTVR